MCTRTQRNKQWPHEPGPDLPTSIGGSPTQAGGNCGSLQEQKHSQRSPKEYLLASAFLEAIIFSPRPGLTLQLASQDTSGQTTNQVGTQPHSSADRLVKVFPSTQLPDKHTSWHGPAQSDKTHSTHQRAGTSPSHREARTSLLDQPHPPRWRHQKKNYNLKPSEWKPQSQKVRQKKTAKE